MSSLVSLSIDGAISNSTGGSHGYMTSLFKNGQKPPTAALEIIERYFNRVARPVYLGTISLEIRWSLARTQEMLEHLTDEGIVRPLTDDEKFSSGFPVEANIYVLVGEPKLSKAWY